MTLTQSEINAFKLKEKAVEDVTDCVILAEASVTYKCSCKVNI